MFSLRALESIGKNTKLNEGIVKYIASETESDCPSETSLATPTRRRSSRNSGRSTFTTTHTPQEAPAEIALKSKISDEEKSDNKDTYIADLQTENREHYQGTEDYSQTEDKGIQEMG